MTLLYNFISVLCNDAAFAMRESKETLFVHVQMKTCNFGLQTEWANWLQPTGQNPARRSNWLVKLRPVVLNPSTSI